MRNLTVGLVLFTFLSMMSGCVGGGGSLNVSSPVWEAGYAFSYREFGSSTSVVSAEGETETQDDEWGPLIRSFEILNTTLEADGEPVYLAGYTVVDQSVDAPRPEERDSGRQGATSMRADMASPMPPSVMFMGFRQRDLQEIPAWVSFDSSCNEQGCTYQAGAVEFADDRGFSHLDFPLEKGKKWSSQREVDGDFFGDLKVEYSARVNGLKTVSTPLGDVKAVRVDWTMRPVDIEAYKREVRDEADDADVELERFEIELQQTGSFYYSEEHMTIVKTTSRGEFLVEFKGNDDGESFEFKSRGSNVRESTLDGIRLVPRAERGLDYILRLATGKAQLSDPGGSTLERVKYGLKVVADKTVVNAAEAESITFNATVEGAAELPEGHFVKWRVLDAVGTDVGTGSGLTLTHEFAQPGEYTVMAEAFDEKEEMTTSNGITVFANFAKTISVDCPLAPGRIGGVYASSCQSVPIPVRPGIQYLRVVADVRSPTALVPALNVAELSVSDRAGNSESDSGREDGQYSVEVQTFWQFLVDDQDWTVDLNHQRGVLEEVTFTVDLRYDGVPDAPATAETEAQRMADAFGAWIGQR